MKREWWFWVVTLSALAAINLAFAFRNVDNWWNTASAFFVAIVLGIFLGGRDAWRVDA